MPVKNGIAARTFQKIAESSQSYFTRTDLIGKFKTSFVEHTLLVGFELGKENYDRSLFISSLPGIDLYHPVYGTSFPANPTPTTFWTRDANTGGVYAQDQISLSRHWKLLIGAREDLAETISTDWTVPGAPGLPPGSSERFQKIIDHPHAFSPRCGIVFQSNSLVSLYASYSKSFDPLGINQTAPVALSPTHGTQYEAGLKLDLLRSRLQTTVSVYRIKQTGLLAGSGVTDLPSGASGSGFQINKGAELDVTGQITADWSLTAAYAFNQGELVEGPMPRPQAPLNAPKHSGTLWTTYQFQRSAFHGLRVGAGVTGVDSRRVLVTSDFRIPDYTRFDVMAAYRLKEGHWTLQLNVRDITAKTYYETTRLAAPFGLIFPMTRVIQPALRFQF